MAYDEVLAGRIRDLIGPDPELTEKKVFGGLASSRLYCIKESSRFVRKCRHISS